MHPLVFRTHWLFKVAVFLAFIVCGCKSKDSDPLPTGVHAGLYGISYSGLRLMLPEKGEYESVCTSDYATSYGRSEGIRYLNISLNDSAEGIYPIMMNDKLRLTDSLLESSDTPAALVLTAVEHDDSYALGEERYYAWGGSVEIIKKEINPLTNTPDYEVKVTAQFPVHRVSTMECESFYDADMQLLNASCTCINEDSTEYSCEASSDDVSCCLDFTSETETVQYHFRTSSCDSYYCTEVTIGHCFTNDPDDTASSDLELDSDSDDGFPYEALTDPDFENCNAIYTDSWVTKSGELWVSGYTSPGQPECPNTGFVKRFDGNTWYLVSLPDSDETNYLSGICELSPNRLFVSTGWSYNLLVSTTDGAVDGTVIPENVAANKQRTGNEGLWCDAEKGLFICGQDGLLLQYANEEWLAVSASVKANWNEIAGDGDGGIAVFGDNGMVLTDSDGGWISIDMEESASLNGGWISPDGEIYAVSGQDGSSEPGRIFRYADGSWETQAEADGDVLLGITSSSSGILYAVGAHRNTSGIANSVVWVGTAEGWSRYELTNLNSFLRGVVCMDSEQCYAYGTDSTFIRLK